MTKTRKSWVMMRQRCNNPNDDHYPSYGGRGITVCERWNSFENFFADMGLRPEGKTLDRKNNELGYTPENCRWATASQQQNNKRTTSKLTIDGRTKTVSEWAKYKNRSVSAIKRRIARGWTPEDAVFTPQRKYPTTIKK